jgi:hypothetical protein
MSTMREEETGTLGLTVRDGRVACPMRGWVELEQCLDCAGYRGFAEGRVERLVCHPDLDQDPNISSSETRS